MSKKNLPNLPFEERKKLAGQVASLRKAANLKQAELANLADISRQTLSNIERGSVPQMDNLRRIYEVLGADIAPTTFTAETEQWLAIVGGIMDSLPDQRKAAAGQAAVAAVTQELVEASNVRGKREAVDLHEIDLSKGDYDLAATKDKSSVEEQSHPDYENESQAMED